MQKRKNIKNRYLEPKDRRLLQRALDNLALLLPSKHTWTNKERKLYEQATEILNVT